VTAAIANGPILSRPRQHRFRPRIGTPLDSPVRVSRQPERAAMPRANAAVDCGWGRLVLGQTFGDPAEIVAALRAEQPGRRDIAAYVTDPHVMLALAPQELFLDPSHTFRLDLGAWRPAERASVGFTMQPLETALQVREANRIYAARAMLPTPDDFLLTHRDCPHLTYLVAVDGRDGGVVGAVSGVDHARAFGDPENGSSLWCLAVDPQAPHPGVGEALVRATADHFKARGRAFMDLSVLHDNACAIALYEKLGFVRVPVFSVKTRSAINERLFIGLQSEKPLGPCAAIITNEARRRGIAVEVLDAKTGYLRLSFGGRSIVCRDSLSELTSAVALSRCEDRAVTLRTLGKAGLAVLLEKFSEGQTLRIVVINRRVVAAALCRPAEVTGTGKHTVARLIEARNRRRATAAGGEGRIPLDDETERCVRRHGRALGDILPEGERLSVREVADPHSGGTLHDVTATLHPALARAAVAAARALAIPVVGLDLLVPDPAGPEYVITAADARPSLASHEPQPTAERFVDLLFPQTAVQRGGRRSLHPHASRHDVD
jgi:ribosomal protein S18 acetylase RimI-like enzyme